MALLPPSAGHRNIRGGEPHNHPFQGISVTLARSGPHDAHKRKVIRS
jgi:hypothetical protein